MLFLENPMFHGKKLSIEFLFIYHNGATSRLYLILERVMRGIRCAISSRFLYIVCDISRHVIINRFDSL
jgi:hypothetical protein